MFRLKQKTARIDTGGVKTIYSKSHTRIVLAVAESVTALLGVLFDFSTLAFFSPREFGMSW